MKTIFLKANGEMREVRLTTEEARNGTVFIENQDGIRFEVTEAIGKYSYVYLDECAVKQIKKEFDRLPMRHGFGPGHDVYMIAEKLTAEEKAFNHYQICIHEAGHLFVWRDFGGDGFIHMLGGNDRFGDTKGTYSHFIPSVYPKDSINAAVVTALAGVCAELAYEHYIHNDGFDWLHSELEVDYLDEVSVWSYGDVLMSKKRGSEPTTDDFITCTDIVIKNIQNIIKEADRLFYDLGYTEADKHWLKEGVCHA